MQESKSCMDPKFCVTLNFDIQSYSLPFLKYLYILGFSVVLGGGDYCLCHYDQPTKHPIEVRVAIHRAIFSEFFGAPVSTSLGFKKTKILRKRL